jgi:glutamate-1-semialdehyde 2,1-aminomutase
MLSLLRESEQSIYHRLEKVGETLAEGLREAARNVQVPVVVNQVGSMLTVFFTEADRVTDYASAKTSDTGRFGVWFRALLDRGIYWPPSQFEAAFLSTAMTDSDIEDLLKAARAAFAEVRLTF